MFIYNVCFTIKYPTLISQSLCHSLSNLSKIYLIQCCSIVFGCYASTIYELEDSLQTVYTL